jgi:ATP-dependent RNA helicase RhlE
MQKLIKGKGSGTQVLILVPTKELAQRVNDHLMAFAKYASIKSATIFSGVSYAPQEAAMEKRPEFIIATPHRLAQHVKRGNVRFEKLAHVVVDELDKIFQAGDRDELIDVLEAVPPEAQFMLFSSSLDDSISNFSDDALQDPVKVISERRREIPRTLKHAIYPVTESEKTALCRHLVEDLSPERTLIFTRTQLRADRLFKELRKSDIPAVRIHGKRDEKKRQRSLDDFRNGTTPVLIITDLSSGILADEKVTLLINFDIPTQSENYINRIATASLTGVDAEAITLVSENDKMMIAQIEDLLSTGLVRRYAPNFAYQKKIEIGRVRLRKDPGRKGAKVEEWKESIGEEAEGRSRHKRRRPDRADGRREPRSKDKPQDDRGKSDKDKKPAKVDSGPEHRQAAAPPAAEGDKPSRRRRKRKSEDQEAKSGAGADKSTKAKPAEEKAPPKKERSRRKSEQRKPAKQEQPEKQQPQVQGHPDPSKMTAYEKMVYFTKGPGARKSPPQHNNHERSNNNDNGLPTPRPSRRKSSGK